MTCTPDKTVLADGKPSVNIKTEATQFYERGMIDMKKKMAARKMENGDDKQEGRRDK